MRQAQQGYTYTPNLDGPKKALYAALAAAQEEIGGAVKGKKNPHFGQKYADLKSVWDAWQEVGPKNGLAVMQLVLEADGKQGIILETVLTHKDGGEIRSRSFWPAVKNDPQAYGSALTYARRYTLSALVGIAPEDDDGNAASRGVKDAQAEEDRARFEAAVAKYANDPAKLTLIRDEARKAGLADIVKKIDTMIKELES